ncbi:MAG: putative bifunctional diguanylate cyclase/phosphodiesterase [Actinomycetota bacterium]
MSEHSAVDRVWAEQADGLPHEVVLGELGDVVVVLAPDLRVAGINSTTATLLGVQTEELIGRNAIDLVYPDDRERAAALLERFGSGIEMSRPSIRLRSGDAPTLAVECVARRLERADGTWLILSGRVEPLLNTEELMDGVGVGIVMWDEQGVITECNNTAERLLGDEHDHLSGSITDLADRLYDLEDSVTVAHAGPRTRHGSARELIDALLGEDTLSGRLGVRDVGGVEHVVEVEVRPVRMRYSRGMAGMLTVRDVTAEHTANSSLRQRALTDDLTGLSNRGAFTSAVTSALASQHGDAVGLLFCDLDRFKSINERFGHGEADRLLQGFAAELRRSFAGHLAVGRLGGDEFAVAVNVLDSDQLEGFADLIHTAARRAGSSTLHLTTTASVGTSWSGWKGAEPLDRRRHTAASLIEEADEALRRAKRSGRDRTAFFDAAMRAERRQQTSMANAVRTHLEAGQIEIAVQPVVDPRTGRVSGGEALARIRDADGVLLPAALWIEAATRAGLLAEVDEQVITLAADLIATLHDRHEANGRPEVHLPVIGVNLSDTTLARSDLDDWLLTLLAAHRAPVSHLVIEIPETVFPVIRDRAAEALRRLKASGAWVAIDDFGIGYASLAEVRDLPIDTLKIDRSFVVAEPGTPEEAILCASVEMAQALGCRSVAEGVETDTQMELLVELGIDYVQGYRSGAPMDAASFVAHAEAHAGAITGPG